MKGDENRFLVISSDADKKEFHQQRGMTEFLLCPTCDNERLSKYEDHVRRVIFGGHRLESEQAGRFLVVSGYDYKKLKNGLLSVLWRMSLSKHRFFANVDLGPRHDERLREAFLYDREFDEEEYPIFLTAPVLDGSALGQCMIPPDFTRSNNRIYRCLISGMIFTFAVGSAALDPEFKKLMLRRDKWPLVRAKVEEIPFLSHAISELGRAINTRNEKNAT